MTLISTLFMIGSIGLIGTYAAYNVYIHRKGVISFSDDVNIFLKIGLFLDELFFGGPPDDIENSYMECVNFDVDKCMEKAGSNAIEIAACQQVDLLCKSQLSACENFNVQNCVDELKNNQGYTMDEAKATCQQYQNECENLVCAYFNYEDCVNSGLYTTDQCKAAREQCRCYDYSICMDEANEITNSAKKHRAISECKHRHPSCV